MNESETMRNIVRNAYLHARGTGAIIIDPAKLADGVYREIESGTEALLVKYVAILQLRQMGRETCRKRIGTFAVPTLFAHLQPMYPVHRDGVEVYALREDMTYQNRREMSARLESEARSKIDHARLLDRETEWLVHTGRLSKTEIEIDTDSFRTEKKSSHTLKSQEAG